MAVRSEQTAAAYYNSLPKKRSWAGVLILNTKGQVLIVKPNYLNRWLCPGGGIEASEAPQVAARRECLEEIGIDVKDLWPAFINYREPKPDGETDVMQFMFTTTPVEDSFLKSLRYQADEIEDAKFVKAEDLQFHLSPSRAKSVLTYLKNKKNRYPLYMENGELVAKL